MILGNNGLGEQALNKILEIALANQFRKIERMEVQSKIDLSRLAHGEVDFIGINVDSLLTQQDLVLEKLKLEISRVIVEPLSALFGKIKLTQPATGTALIVINQDDLTCACNTESFRWYQQNFIKEKDLTIKAQQVMLENGSIIIKSQFLGETEDFLTFPATPQIATNGQGIVLQDLQYEQAHQFLSELAIALSTQISEILSLRSFEQIGMILRIQQLNVSAGKLILQGTVEINQFPST